MPELDAKHRNELDEDQFAFPKERKEPLNNASHVRNAQVLKRSRSTRRRC